MLYLRRRILFREFTTMTTMLVQPPLVETSLTVRGTAYPTHYDAATEYGVPWYLYLARLTRGEAPEDILWPGHARAFDPLNVIVYNGETYNSVYDLAKHLNIDAHALFWMAYSKELTPEHVNIIRLQDSEQILKERPKRTKFYVKYAVQGRPFATFADICRAFPIKYTDFLRQMDAGDTVQKAVKKLLNHYDVSKYDGETEAPRRRAFLKALGAECCQCFYQPQTSFGLFIHPHSESAPRVSFRPTYPDLVVDDYFLLCHYCKCVKNFR